MRIISQDGMIDVPYEQFIISLNTQDMHEVIAWTGENIKDDECITLAYYFTESRARKAMEMLRTAYQGNKIEKTYHEGTNYYHPIFQFPADDEMEV